jgi:hypothetical protein
VRPDLGHQAVGAEVGRRGEGPPRAVEAVSDGAGRLRQLAPGEEGLPRAEEGAQPHRPCSIHVRARPAAPAGRSRFGTLQADPSDASLSQRPPEHIRVFADAGDSIRVLPQLVNWPEIGRAIITELSPLFDGQVPAREAAEAVKRAVNPLLRPAR